MGVPVDQLHSREPPVGLCEQGAPDRLAPRLDSYRAHDRIFSTAMCTAPPTGTLSDRAHRPSVTLGSVPDPTSSPDFDETKHPRGQPDNPGKFKRRPLPAPPLVKRRGSGEPQEEASSDKSPPPKKLRKARAAERAATGAIVLSVSAATLGWTSTFEVQLMMWVAVAAVAVLTVRALPELRQRWREGTQLKHESDLLSELNGHLSRLVAHAAEATAAVKGFDEATEQSDQRTPERSKMADSMRRALVEEARERAAAAAAATGRARAAAALPHPKRTDAIAELIKELEAAVP